MRSDRILFIILAFVILLSFIVSVPSEEEIQACTDQTGWSVERCRVELSR